MKIEHHIPAEILKPFIKAFMFIESESETNNFVLPDTAMVWAIRYKGSVSVEENGNIIYLPATVFSGIRKSPRLIKYSKDAANLLVIFNEGGTIAFSRTPAHELFGLTVSAESLFHSAIQNEIVERVAEANTNKERVDIIEAFLLRKLTNSKPDILVHNAVQLIKHQTGIIRIKDLASSLHISQDAFEKRFRTLIGATPKQYASIIRLRSLITKYHSVSSLTEASYEAGYFDQSHFIKDFRLFTGQAPKDFFKFSRYW